MNKKNKRIVIVGSAGIGKTTLAEKLAKKIKLKLIPEQARVICTLYGFKTIYEITNPNVFRQRVLNAQIKEEEELNTFLSDRSTIDCWVHWLRWSCNKALASETKNYFNKAYNQALKYSDIIYIPRNSTHSSNTKALSSKFNDGFRWNNEDYQNQVDRLFKEILLDWDLMKRTLIITSHSLKNRIKEVINFLNQHMPISFKS